MSLWSEQPGGEPQPTNSVSYSGNDEVDFSVEMPEELAGMVLCEGWWLGPWTVVNSWAVPGGSGCLNLGSWAFNAKNGVCPPQSGRHRRRLEGDGFCVLDPTLGLWRRGGAGAVIPALAGPLRVSEQIVTWFSHNNWRTLALHA